MRLRYDFQPLKNLPSGVHQCVRCAVLVGAGYIKSGAQANLCIYCENELKQEEKQEIEKDGIQLDS